MLRMPRVSLDLPAIEVTDLRKRYGQVDALAGLTMTVGRGEVFGFLGPNGAGKTTTVKLLLGLARPTSGSGTVLGAPMGDLATRRKIGYLPELFRYQQWLKAREVLTLHGELIGHRRARRRGAAADEALRIVGLADRVGRHRRQVLEGHAAAPRPRHGAPRRAGADRPRRADLRARPGRPGRRPRDRPRGRGSRGGGVPELHLLSEVEQVCDRVAIIDHGRVVASGDLDDVLGQAETQVRVSGISPSDLPAFERFGTPTLDGDRLAIRPMDAELVPDLVATLVGMGAKVHEVQAGGARSSTASWTSWPATGHPPGPRARQRLQMITIAKLTIGEAARRRVLWVLVILAAVAVGLTTWGVSALVEGARDRGVGELEIKFAVSQILIFIAFMFGFVLVMTAAFFGSPAIATDLESGIAQAMLARPLRRSSYLLGRWLGLAIVMVVYAAIAGLPRDRCRGPRLGLHPAGPDPARRLPRRPGADPAVADRAPVDAPGADRRRRDRGRCLRAGVDGRRPRQDRPRDRHDEPGHRERRGPLPAADRRALAGRGVRPRAIVRDQLGAATRSSRASSPFFAASPPSAGDPGVGGDLDDPRPRRSRSTSSGGASCRVAGPAAAPVPRPWGERERGEHGAVRRRACAGAA